MLKATNSGKIRTLAGALSNEQMEYLRNLPYDSLATENGTILPQGNIPDSQTVTRGGVTFTLNTTIIFVDDPFDGCAIPNGNNTYLCTDGGVSGTQDLVPVDYKRINVEALKVGTPTVLIKLSSNAAAKAAETPSNTGMMLVKVIDSKGAPVANATVNVTDVVTGVDLQGTTNAQGYMFVANLTPDTHNGYHIDATKQGYSTDYTTSRTAQNPNQVQPDVDINVQQVTIQTLKIDLLATMSVTVTDENNQPLSGVSITATSEKLVANNPDTPKNTFTQSTNSSGVVTFSNIEWDGYNLAAAGNYKIVATSPYQPVSLDPNTTLPVALVITTNVNWPRIDSVSPTSGTSGSNVTVVISGANFAGGTTVLLRLAGHADITPTSTNVAANGKTVTLTFHLTGAAAGDWDIVLNSGGSIVTEIEGFTVS